MDSKRSASIVVECEGHRPRLAVEFPLTPMQRQLLARAVSQGSECVPSSLQDELQDAIEHVSKAVVCVGA